jgi:Fuc2NAc and GlcNAc transferase
LFFGIGVFVVSHWVIFAFILPFSWGLTRWLRNFALAKNIIDMPNFRSSHVVPTPRGGGVAIVISFIVALFICYYIGLMGKNIFFALVAGGGGVAAIGFFDDLGHVAARWRLLVHVICAGTAVFFLGEAGSIEFGSLLLAPGWFYSIFVVLFLVWLINLYNFMDGIDGVAGIEAITVCVGMCLVYWLTGNLEGSPAPIFLALAVGGFLIHNFPPAKIFMGDAGSGFLGVSLGIITIESASVDSLYFWAWCILLGVFVVDATVTLLRRLFSGAKVHEAHRTHAYQYASRALGAHLPVTVIVAMINVFWLLPIAILLVWYRIPGLYTAIFAYLPLVVLAYKLKAGVAES